MRQATLESLRWQNGLEPSHTRSIVHALRRFGMREECLLAEMSKRQSADDFALLQKNFKSVVYEPRVAASAYALAAVWDRVRYGTLSQELATPVLRQQACRFGDRAGCPNRGLFVVLRATADK